MKFCSNCEGPSGSCCDFCKHYAFNADAGGFYVGEGFGKDIKDLYDIEELVLVAFKK
jgi:hypothetical protein